MEWESPRFCHQRTRFELDVTLIHASGTSAALAKLSSAALFTRLFTLKVDLTSGNTPQHIEPQPSQPCLAALRDLLD